MDPTTLLMLAVVAALFIFLFRRQRKQQREAQNMQSQLAPGAEVMTSFGVFGTVVAVDDEENQVLIESTPGTELRVHRQAIGKVLRPAAVPGGDDVADAPEAVETAEGPEQDAETGTDRPVDTEKN